MPQQPATTRHIAIDLGADSGRVVLGELTGDRLRATVLHRFPNTPTRGTDSLRWEVESLWTGIVEGLRLAAAGGGADTVGIDTWGVDYTLVDADGRLLEAPWHHRDGRTAGIAEEIHAKLGGEAALFARTGTRSLPFNSVFQLVAHQRRDPAILARAHRFLTVPDYFAARLSGVMANEWSNAGTTGLTTAGQPRWERRLIQELGLPDHLFQDPVTSGTVLGPLRSELASETGFAVAPQVVAVGAHDTASAVAAVPWSGPGIAYLSCGTWSLLGVLADQPVTNPEALAGGLSNEIAVDGRIRLLKNIMGLWVAQETRRDLLAEGVQLDHAELAAAAAATAGARATIDIDDPRLFPTSRPGDRMLDRIRAMSAALGLPAQTPGEVFRRIFEGLAASYARTVRDLGLATGVPVTRLAIIGGGCRNRLLCQLTADACRIPVSAGPDEGTALGNLLVQAGALGVLPAARWGATVRASVEISEYLPGAAAAR